MFQESNYREIEEVIVHEKYNSKYKGLFDIGLVKVTEPFAAHVYPQYSEPYIFAACLPLENNLREFPPTYKDTVMVSF